MGNPHYTREYNPDTLDVTAQCTGIGTHVRLVPATDRL
jgi:hypothetical protein